MSICTTLGAIMLTFYDQNPYSIMWAWQLMGYSSNMYIIININEQCDRFPSNSGMTIGLINGLYDASAGMFLFYKVIYEAQLATLNQLLIGFALMTSIIWIKTFFFTPYKTVKPEVTTFNSSVVTLCCEKDKKPEMNFEDIKEEPEVNSESKKNKFSEEEKPEVPLAMEETEVEKPEVEPEVTKSRKTKFCRICDARTRVPVRIRRG